MPDLCVQKYFKIGSINEEGRLVYEQMVEGASQQKGMVKSLVFSCPSSSGPKHQATIPLLGTPESSMAFAQVKQPQPQSESKKRSASDPTDQSSKLFLAAGDAGSSSVGCSFELPLTIFPNPKPTKSFLSFSFSSKAVALGSQECWSQPKQARIKAKAGDRCESLFCQGGFPGCAERGRTLFVQLQVISLLFHFYFLVTFVYSRCLEIIRR